MQIWMKIEDGLENISLKRKETIINSQDHLPTLYQMYTSKPMEVSKWSFFITQLDIDVIYAGVK